MAASTPFLRYPGTLNNGLLAALLTLMTTELESVTNGSLALSSVGGSSGLFTNANTGQAIWGELYYDSGSPNLSTPSAGANLTGWWITSPDGGTTFEQTTDAPARPPDWLIQVVNLSITANWVFKSGIVRVPALPFKVLVQNNLGVTLSSGTTNAPYLKLAPCADQY